MREEKVLQILGNGIITESGFKSVSTNAGFGIGSSVFTQDGCVIGWDFLPENKPKSLNVHRGFFERETLFKITEDYKLAKIAYSSRSLLTSLLYPPEIDYVMGNGALGFGRFYEYFYSFYAITEVFQDYRKESLYLRIIIGNTPFDFKLSEATFNVSSEIIYSFYSGLFVSISVFDYDLENRIMNLYLNCYSNFSDGSSETEMSQRNEIYNLKIDFKNISYQIDTLLYQEDSISRNSPPINRKIQLKDGYVIQNPNSNLYNVCGFEYEESCENDMSLRFNSLNQNGEIIVLHWNKYSGNSYLIFNENGFKDSGLLLGTDERQQMLFSLFDLNEQIVYDSTL